MSRKHVIHNENTSYQSFRRRYWEAHGQLLLGKWHVVTLTPLGTMTTCRQFIERLQLSLENSKCIDYAILGFEIGEIDSKPHVHGMIHTAQENYKFQGLRKYFNFLPGKKLTETWLHYCVKHRPSWYLFKNRGRLMVYREVVKREFYSTWKPLGLEESLLNRNASKYFNKIKYYRVHQIKILGYLIEQLKLQTDAGQTQKSIEEYKEDSGEGSTHG